MSNHSTQCRFNNDVLVLNKCFMPLHVITWKRTMSLLVQDKCRVIDCDFIHYDYEAWIKSTEIIDSSQYNFIHTVKHRMAIPHVILLTAYDRLPRNQVKYSRESVFHRDKFRCGYCGGTFRAKDLTIDHINPKSVGGPKSWQNTISACKRCNAIKANRTPTEANMPLLFQPTEPSWFQQIKNLAERINIKPQWKPFLDSFILKENKE